MEPVDILKREKVQMARLDELRRYIYTPLAKLNVTFAPSDEPISWEEHDMLQYRPLPKNGRWADVFGCAWFRIRGTVPREAAGRHVIAHIDLGGEGLVYQSGGTKLPVGAVTLDTSFIDRLQSVVAKTVVEIGNPVQGGEDVAFDIDAGFNGYYNHPAGRAYFRCAELCAVDDVWLQYYYDYLTVASFMSCQQDAQKEELKALLDESYAAKDVSLELGRRVLNRVLNRVGDNSLELTAIGHSHLDLAWLWPIRETKRKACRTFAHQITNMRRYPDYIYGASQPQQFQFVKDSHPALYAQLQEFARRGQLECQGAMWVEADCNLPSGESLIRQIIYGKRFFREEFGQEIRICWLPDVFGYNGNLPQILKKSGIPYFLTIKLSWNEHNPFPNRSFRWQGIDGSEVLTHMPPAETYNAAASPACAAFARDHYPERGISHHAVLLYGIGDGGGGPSEAHIEMGRRQQTLRDSPVVRFGTAGDFFQKLESEKDALPVYRGELYLEKHQGTYTTQAKNKRFNRQCEFGLQTVEELCVRASNLGHPYPAETLDGLWKRVLLLQFHDILPGSSIQRVYTGSGAEYEQITEALHKERDQALDALKAAGEGWSAYNPTSFDRKVFVKHQGRWLTGTIPAHGADILKPCAEAVRQPAGCLDNGLVRVIFSPEGSIRHFIDLKTGFDYAGAFLNRLTLYEDPFLPYNAWDIDWEYHLKPYQVLTAQSMEFCTDGPAQICRIMYDHGETKIWQEILLFPDTPVVYVHTTCHWSEKLKMLRADFAPSVWSARVKCGIQMGEIFRSTREDTPQEKAQFEICAHQYVDVSDEQRGLSLMNDCKYGHRAKNGLLSLNLLRATVLPDPEADLGDHEFTYALLPHEGACGVETVAQSAFLNQPPVVTSGNLSLPSMARTTCSNVIVETIKAAEDGTGLVLRLYEATGCACVTALETDFSYRTVHACDLEEQNPEPVDISALSFGPYEIKTLKFQC